LAAQLDLDPALVSRQFPELDIGATGVRQLTLQGATLLDVAAEYVNLEAAMLLVDRGVDVHARATMDASGIGRPTSIFHAVTQYLDWGLSVAPAIAEARSRSSVWVRSSRVTMSGREKWSNARRRDSH
jgi:hypothetical protein